MPPSSEIPRRRFGRHDEQVSALALGGYHIGSVKTEREATRIVHEAMDAGLTFMDNAWDYHEGGSEIRMGKALKGRRERAFVMTKVCTTARRRVALRQPSIAARLQTDYRSLADPRILLTKRARTHFARGGVVSSSRRRRLPVMCATWVTATRSASPLRMRVRVRSTASLPLQRVHATSQFRAAFLPARQQVSRRSA